MYRAADAFLHQVVGGRWRLLEVLGATEHGAAFRAETLENGRLARLELWDPRHVENRGELARFEREARTLSRLQHPRLVSVTAFGAHEGRPFLVSDLPEGQTLRDELANPELTVPRALSLGLQLCEALRHLHGHGVVHRALRPDNAWIGPAADSLTLGLPRLGPTAAPAPAERDRSYLPPERSTGRADVRADLYAAGMLLYVMCTGREPPAEVAAGMASGTPVPPPRVVSPERGITEGLERVILRAVAPSPDVRFGSADELLAALQSAGARPPSPKRRPEPPRRQRTAILAAVCATVALLGAGALRSAGGRASSASPAVQTASVPAPPVEAPSVPAPAVEAPSVPPPAAQPPRAATPAPVPAPAPVAPRPPIAVASVEPESPAAPRPPIAVASVEPKPEPPAAARPPIAVASVEPRPEPPAAARPPIAVASVEPRPEPPAAAVRRGSADASGAPLPDERRQIWSLLDSGRLDEGAARIRALVAADPDAAWPQFALGVFYTRKYWRRDAVRHWELALEQDPDIRQDPQFGAYLCFMLDDSWKAAGMTELLNRLGSRAAPLLEQCADSAKTPQLRALASRTLARLPRRHPRASR